MRRKESSGNKTIKMDNNKILASDNAVKESVVIPDECGDTLWDDVLKQEAIVLSIHDSIEKKYPEKNDVDYIKEH